jgi:hypothetical protein
MVPKTAQANHFEDSECHALGVEANKIGTQPRKTMGALPTKVWMRKFPY